MGLLSLAAGVTRAMGTWGISGGVSGGSGQREVPTHLAQGQGAERVGWGNSHSSLPFSALRLLRHSGKSPASLMTSHHVRGHAAHTPMAQRGNQGSTATTCGAPHARWWSE